MAEAEKVTKVVKKMVEVKTEETTYHLELNFEELKTLRAIFNRVGGSPINSPRRHMDAMADAIDAAVGKDRYDWTWAAPEVDLASKQHDGIYFNEYPESTDETV